MAKDIISVSYAHMPVAKTLSPERAQFTCRVTLVRDVVAVAENTFPAVIKLPEGREGWVEVWWEQRSAGRKGSFLMPPDGVNEVNLPRVSLVRRPR